MIQHPKVTLPRLAIPCTAKKSGLPRRNDHRTGRLSASPISIMLKIEPHPNTAIYIKPSMMLSAEATTSNSNAAEPANPWAIPMHKGRTDSRHQCPWP
jgi:hypothetical protein